MKLGFSHSERDPGDVKGLLWDDVTGVQLPEDRRRPTDVGVTRARFPTAQSALRTRSPSLGRRELVSVGFGGAPLHLHPLLRAPHHLTGGTFLIVKGGEAGVLLCVLTFYVVLPERNQSPQSP